LATLLLHRIQSIEARARLGLGHALADHELVATIGHALDEAIGPIAGVTVPLIGLDSVGALPRSTWDAGSSMCWSRATVAASGPRRLACAWSLRAPAASAWRQFEDVRAASHSAPGQTLVIAEQHTLHLFHR
jgi:hypothetical protein